VDAVASQGEVESQRRFAPIVIQILVRPAGAEGLWTDSHPRMNAARVISPLAAQALSPQ